MLVKGPVDPVRSVCPIDPGVCSCPTFLVTCLSHDTPLSEQVVLTCAQARLKQPFLDEPFCIGECNMFVLHFLYLQPFFQSCSLNGYVQ